MSELTAFLEEFAFDPADAAVLTDAYRRILENETAASAFEEAAMLYRDGGSCDHERILACADAAAKAADVQEYTAELLIYLLLAPLLRERYAARGIDDAIFQNTILDLRYKLEECKLVKGVVGSFVASWFAGFFDMTRFALGRLQFELTPFGEEFVCDGAALSADTPVINVHIPRDGTPLDAVRCDEAFDAAKAFFAEGRAFVCFSWLLDPTLVAILPEESNIRRFAERFALVKSGINKARPDLWRLFDTEEQHPARLPTDTTVRRIVVDHLLAGGKLGWGYGVFVK